METKRYHLHGDITEDGKSFYDARKDEFVPIENRHEGTALDISRYKMGVKSLASRQRQLRARDILTPLRPADAKNIFSAHPLMTANPSALMAAVRRERREIRSQ